MMTNEQFDALVARLEQEARGNPRRYQLKVLLLAWLGNAYLALVLGLMLAMMLGLAASVLVLKALAFKLLLVFGVFIWGVVKAMWVRVEPPTGFEVTRREAPQLFALLDELRRALKAPRFHHVLVVNDYNAAVAQVPRLGIFGWPRNYLLIGLPLMKTLTIEQFKAVLAHEMGHLSGGHGRLGNWIYRQRQRWMQLMRMLDEQGRQGRFLFKPFLDRFAPYFNAYSFPLARANEYEADAVAARLTSPQVMGAALTSVDVIDSYLSQRYWPQIFKQAEDQPLPSFLPYHAMAADVAGGLEASATQGWLEQALQRQTTVADTHPALADRLQALGVAPQVASPAAGQAADALLGTALPTVTTHFDQRWRDDVRPAWESRYREVQQGRQQLAELNDLVAAGTELSLQQAFDRACLTESVGAAPDDALEQFRALHDRAPEQGLACLALGARLLNRQDEAGVELVRRAMELDENLTARGCETLRDFYWQQDRRDEAHGWHARLVERVNEQQGAEQERQRLLTTDTFEPHGLPAEQWQPLLAALRKVPGLQRVYLVRKRVRHLKHRPCYVLGFSTTPWYLLHSSDRSSAALRAIQAQVAFPGETILVGVDGSNARFGRKFKKVRGSRLI